MSSYEETFKKKIDSPIVHLALQPEILLLLEKILEERGLTIVGPLPDEDTESEIPVFIIGAKL